MSLQQHHQDYYPAQSSTPLYLVCDQITSPANLGSIFRSADAFGVHHIYLYRMSEELLQSKRLRRTSRSTDTKIEYRHVEDLDELRTILDERNVTPIALELTHSSKSLATFDALSDKSVALIVGNENFGICESVLTLTRLHFHIDMYGQNSSMNVAVAASIAMYHIRKQQLQNSDSQ